MCACRPANLRPRWLDAAAAERAARARALHAQVTHHQGPLVVGIPRTQALRLPLPLQAVALALLPPGLLPVPHQEHVPVGQAPPKALR